MTSIRTFIALPTQIQVQNAIAKVQEILKETNSDVKWESQEKFHITLKFLGNVEPAKIELLSTALSKSLSKFSTFKISYNSIGAFPNLTNPRVVWIGTEPNQFIQNIQAEVEQICLQFGFPKEERKFHPHITLGRINGKLNFTRLTEAIKTITFEPIESQCSEVLLMKSDLKPSGSVYTILKSHPLKT